MASLLLDDFKDAVAHFGKHPVTVPMSKEESTGFNHLCSAGRFPPRRDQRPNHLNSVHRQVRSKLVI